MKVLLLLAVTVAVALSTPVKSDYQTQQTVHRPAYKPDAHAAPHNSKLKYHGKYTDKCDNDGFYYRDYDTFVICSNNNAYVQQCAPGSRNSPFDKYTYGGAYSQRDFCDVNLNDLGYGKPDKYDADDKYDGDRYDGDRYEGDRYDGDHYDGDRYAPDRRHYGYNGQYNDGGRYYGNNDGYYGDNDRFSRRRYSGGYDRYNRREYYPDDRFYGREGRYYGGRHY